MYLSSDDVSFVPIKNYYKVYTVQLQNAKWISSPNKVSLYFFSFVNMNHL